MGHPIRVAVVLAAWGVVVAGCAAQAGVRVGESASIGGARPDPTLAPPAGTATTTPVVTTVPSPIHDEAQMTFGSCGRYVQGAQAPPSPSWECATLAVAIDPADRDAGVVHLAVTRLEGRYSDGRALVVNPGGPGNAGLPFVWSIADTLPTDVVNSYDIVSWDPRGVGMSTPRVACPRGARWSDADLLRRCDDDSGGLMEYMATPYHVRDLDQLRRSLGQDRLNYLGYSYGTFLGAQYANRFPEAVGRFVLDGAVDPASGTVMAPYFAGDPWYAADDSSEVTGRFFELCDASDRCDLGPDSAAAFDRIVAVVASIPTERFPGELAIDPVTLDAVLITSMLDPSNWGFLATALEDAAAGDGSTVAALADLLEVSSAYYGDLVGAFDSEGVARLAIYCADFQSHPRRPSACGGMPDNEMIPAELASIDVEQPVLVIGTSFDPNTPGRHAVAMTSRLGDAVGLYWDGVGHTAFPYNSWCIDDTVEAYLADGALPDDGTHCDFVDGMFTDSEVADLLFGLDATYLEPWIVEVLEPVLGADAECGAARLADSDDQTLVHVLLGVTSAVAESAIDEAAASCAPN
jgi:pimeloyl-ACP methyl ester carboxylesterase